jgi:hypothetical protein
MPANPPIDFEERVKRASGKMGSDYPYAIKATDLMQNFVFATLDIDPAYVEQTNGLGGHAQRKLKLPALPGSGTHVLGVVDGTIQWIATEECD